MSCSVRTERKQEKTKLLREECFSLPLSEDSKDLDLLLPSSVGALEQEQRGLAKMSLILHLHLYSSMAPYRGVGFMEGLGLGSSLCSAGNAVLGTLPQSADSLCSGAFQPLTYSSASMYTRLRIYGHGNSGC